MRANLAAPGRQRGMALLVVLLILSVMVIIASNMSGRLQLELRRTANITTGKQAWWYALSAEALVSKVLTQDFKDNPEVVNLSQNWARKNTVFPVDDGQLKGEVTDLQSCFNLNSLSVASKAGSGEELAQQPYRCKCFANCSNSWRWMITRRPSSPMPSVIGLTRIRCWSPALAQRTPITRVSSHLI